MIMERTRSIRGWIVILGLLIVLCPPLLRPEVESPRHGALTGYSPVNQREAEESDLFFKAKEQVFSHKWTQALKGFEAYLKEFQNGRYRDEARYWLAQSLNGIAGEERESGTKLNLKKKAVDVINDLIETHPDSLWQDDARALRIEIAAELVLVGRDEFKRYIDEAVGSEAKDPLELRLLALDSLMEWDPDQAIRILRRILEAEDESDVRVRSARILGRTGTPEALEILARTAKVDKDEAVRAEAVRWIQRSRIMQIPVQLDYSVFGAMVVDDSLRKRFPEEQVHDLSLPGAGPDDQTELQRRVREAMGSGITRILRSARARIPYPLFLDNTRVSNRAGDYLIWLNHGALSMTETSISGDIEFRNIQSGRILTHGFSTGPRNSRLLVLRSGDRLSLVAVEFGSRDVSPGSGEDEAPASDREPDESAVEADDFGPFESRIAITYDRGIKFYTTRQEFEAGEFQGSLMDFGLARVVIPEKGQTSRADLYSSPSGRTWTLIGDVFRLVSGNRIVGFESLLADPDGRIAARGLIVVPEDDPAGFRVLTGQTGMKRDEYLDPSDVRRTRPIYPSVYSNVQGWQVLTTINAGALGSGGKKDFGLAKAIWPRDGREWILIGRLILLGDENVWLARKAALISREGEIVFGAEIRVPTGNPAGHALVPRK